jgi:hypothetical protein
MLVALYILKEEEARYRLKRGRQGRQAVPLHDGRSVSQSRRQGGVAPASVVHDLRLAVTSLLSSVQSVKSMAGKGRRELSRSLGRRGWSWHARRLYLRCRNHTLSNASTPPTITTTTTTTTQNTITVTPSTKIMC